MRHIAAGHLCAFLFFNSLSAQEIDSSIIISDFQYPDIFGVPIILDESGENTYFLNEWIPELISDGRINQIKLDGSLGIPLGSYFLPKILPKNSQAQPSVPIVSEDDYFDEDIIIESTDPIAPAETIRSTPPPLEDSVKVKFNPYDKAPKSKIPIRPDYPKTAQKAGIEGTVYIQFFIDSKGNVTEAWVQKGIPNTGLNEAALAAVKKSKWKPAQQRDKNVGVWQTVPVKFELTSNDVEKKYYNVFITSEPSFALVEIDNKSIGVTPIKTHLETGRYTLTIKKNNYVEEQENLFVSKIDKAGNTKHFVLKKKDKN